MTIAVSLRVSQNTPPCRTGSFAAFMHLFRFSLKIDQNVLTVFPSSDKPFKTWKQ